MKEKFSKLANNNNNEDDKKTDWFFKNFLRNKSFRYK